MLKPTETLNLVRTTAISKASASIRKLLILGFLAGTFIALAALAGTIVSADLLSNPATFGLGKLIQGLVFSSGLIMVVLGSAELFTGNILMLTAIFNRQITAKQLLRNWGLVYFGNFLGSVFIAGTATLAGLFNANATLSAATIAAATTKGSLDFLTALTLGLLCNFLVCLAVWLAFSATTTSGKVLSIVFPIMLFIVCGFEHSIANMYYLPAGMFASGEFNLMPLIYNLIPVTIGNLLGGGIFVAMSYHFALNNDIISLCQTKKSTRQTPTPSRNAASRREPKPKS